MPTRSLPAEKQAIATFQKTTGKLPTSSTDWGKIHRLAYPTLNDLPDEFKATEAASYYDSGVNNPAAPTPAVPNLTGGSDPNYLQSLVGQTNQAATAKNQAFNAYDQMPSGNSALRILQEAIKAKANPRDFAQAPIGESEVFKQAGVGGFGALAQSLNARGQELDSNRADFANTIGQMADVYKTNAIGVQRRYEKSVEDYKFIANQLNDVMNQVRSDEQQMKVIHLQNDLAKELETIRFGHDVTLKGIPSVSEQTTALNSGYEVTGGRVTDPSKGIVEGFNIGRYATDPAHERNVASIVQGIGKFNTLDDVSAYITRKYPGSPVTADMVSKASEKYGVPWEMLVAMMEQDSSLGTQGKGARTFNPGNVGNDDAGNIRNYGNWQSGVDAVAKWLDKNRATGSSSNSKAADTARDIFSGASGLTLTGVPTKDREAVSKELTKLRDEALKTNDVQGMVRASAGGTTPSDAFKQSFEKGINVVSQIGDLQNTIKGEATGPIEGIIRSKNPYDKKAALIKAQLTSIVPNLARGVYGEVGVLTDNDVALYAKTLPNLTSTEDVNKLILGATIRSVQRSLETKLKVQAGSGVDVSGLLGTYNEVKAQADALLGVTAGQTDPHNILSDATNPDNDPLGIR